MLLVQLLLLPLLLSMVAGKLSRPIDVGTTLFRLPDLNRQCWSAENIALLKYRQIFQDLLPELNTAVTYQTVSAFLEFASVVLQEAATANDKNTDESYPVQLLVSQAAADALGGYVQAFLLPRVRRGVYAGRIELAYALALEDLLGSLRRLLHTDGAYWRPQDDEGAANEEPPPNVLRVELEQPPAPSTSSLPQKRNVACQTCPPCDQLVTYPRASGNSFVIPIPFLDDKYEPATVAVPFKPIALYRLEATSSVMIIAKYYLTSIKCLQGNGAPREEINGFNEYMYVWLVKEVVPHLSDGKLYPAFGGVLRILQTMLSSGIGSSSGNQYQIPSHLNKYLHPEGFNMDYYKPSEEMETANLNRSSPMGNEAVPPQFKIVRGPPSTTNGMLGPFSLNSAAVAMVAALTAAVMWFLVALLLLCARCCRSCRRHSDPNAGFFYNVFVSIFYTVKESLSPKQSQDVEQPKRQQVPPMSQLPAMESSITRYQMPPPASSTPPSKPVSRAPPKGLSGISVSVSRSPPRSTSTAGGNMTTGTDTDYSGATSDSNETHHTQ